MDSARLSKDMNLETVYLGLKLSCPRLYDD
jgi:hypothetical protein